jgi:hypothetical protein
MRMGWEGHVACIGGKGEMYTEFLWGDLWERDYLESLGVDGKRLLK